MLPGFVPVGGSEGTPSKNVDLTLPVTNLGGSVGADGEPRGGA